MGRGLESFARALLIVVSMLVLASCGSGAVGPVVNDPAKITLLPCSCVTSATTTCPPVVLYSGLPTTFTITGGTGTYIVSSSNQAIVQVSGALTGSTLTVIPNPVVSETSLTLTARDTGSTSPETITLTVRPGTVSNTITITPSSSACAPALCSGGDAVISTVISQGGIPLPARGVRFDVVSGDVAFITSPAGQPETTALSVTTTTDETGTARARLRAGSLAPNQTAIVQVTDLGSGAYQRTTLLVALASATQTSFFATPSTLTFTGPNNQTCANTGSSTIFVFGGTPPYTVSNTRPDAFSTNPTVIGQSGGGVQVSPGGLCVDGAIIGFTDAAGRSTSVTVSNKVGSATVPTPPAFTISPTAVTLTSCTAVANVTAIGGQSNGVYRATTNYPVVMGTVSGGIITIQRKPGTDATGITGIQVAVTDGATIKTVDVTLSPAAAGVCP